MDAENDQYLDPAHRNRLIRFRGHEDNAAIGIAMFGEHVVNYVGRDLPWSGWGKIAIQHFRCRNTVYFIGGDVGLIKIGMSICPLERLASFQLGSPIDLRILALTPGGFDVEDSYHERFAEFRVRGEWFKDAPAILAEIARLSESRNV